MQTYCDLRAESGPREVVVALCPDEEVRSEENMGAVRHMYFVATN